MKITQVVAALIWREDKILICRRPANKARALLWEFPGGKVEAGETKQQALVRECREELGITVVPGSVYYEVTHTYPDITIHLTLFNCTAKGEPQRLEHAALKWVQPHDVTAYDFCPADKAIVAEIAAQANAKIKTERLYLRELTISDEAELKTFLQDEEVMYAWEAPFTDTEVTAWLTENLRRYKADGFSFYAVIEKCSGKFLGVCGPLIETINGERRMGVAYIFNKACWGNGYAAEAAQASVNYAFGALGAEEVIAEIRPENKKSRRVAERLGMEVCGSFVKTYKGKEMPHFIYVLSKPQKSGRNGAGNV